MSRRSIALACVLVGLAVGGCSSDDAIPDGEFPCGLHGGSCEVGVDVCVVVDGCSTCVAAPDPCAAGSGCECLDEAMDVDPLLDSCHGQGVCELSGDGLSVSCDESDPEFSCG